MSDSRPAVWCLLVTLWQMATISSGQTCNCTVPSSCDSPQFCFDDRKCNIENVALGRSANMSTYKVDSTACQAVDGNNSNWAESSAGDFTAWWYVDLGRNYTITNITIYPRPGWPARMADLQVLVDSQLCYTFPSHDEIDRLRYLRVPTDIQCPMPLTGRVILLQKVNTDRSDDYRTHLIDVSEVLVWGCADGYHGADCTLCGQCAGIAPCDVVTGQCPDGCQPGWQGTQCDEKCDSGTFGQNCGDQCGHCSENSTCHRVTGECPTGCQAGYRGVFCKEKCAAGRFGQNCGGQCGWCSENSTCHHVTGECPIGCQAGYQGTFCDRLCESGTHGTNCSSQCSQCAGDRTCSAVTGDCPQGCQDGWRGTRCDQPLAVPQSEKLDGSPGVPVGPLVGAIIGGFTVLGLIIVVPIVIVLRRYRSRQATTTEQTPTSPAKLQSQNVDTQRPSSPVVPLHTGLSPLDDQPDLSSPYEDIGEQQHQYDSLQSEDQRSVSTSVYTGLSVVKTDTADGDKVYYENAEHKKTKKDGKSDGNCTNL